MQTETSCLSLARRVALGGIVTALSARPGVLGAEGSGAHAGHAAHAAHDHARQVEVESGAVPGLRVAVVPDPVAGWNVLAEVHDFRFAPEHASAAHHPGEGHAHLYVDGVKVARVYGPAFHLPPLTPGSHRVKLSLNTNDHAAYVHGGQAIEDEVEIEVSEPIRCGEAENPMVTALPRASGHGDVADSESFPAPRLALRVVRDSMAGWNVLADIENFRFTPERSGLAPRPGEGHAELLLDGAEVARLYGPAFHLPAPPAGPHVVTLTLVASDNTPLGIAASVSIE